jgi:hypothetical protein
MTQTFSPGSFGLAAVAMRLALDFDECELADYQRQSRDIGRYELPVTGAKEG